LRIATALSGAVVTDRRLIMLEHFDVELDFELKEKVGK
jgi:hypothetical protein